MASLVVAIFDGLAIAADFGDLPTCLVVEKVVVEAGGVRHPPQLAVLVVKVGLRPTLGPRTRVGLADELTGLVVGRDGCVVDGGRDGGGRRSVVEDEGRR